MAGGRCFTNADFFPCTPCGSSIVPMAWKVWDQGRKLGVGGGTGKERSPAGVSEQVGGLTYSAHSQDLA